MVAVSYLCSNLNRIRPNPMKIYAIAKKITDYGHGDCVTDIHVCPMNAYSDELKFHPIFDDPNEAKRYLNGLDYHSDMLIVELSTLK